MKLNPRQLQSAMQRLGIQQVEVPAKLVVIHTEDKEIIISNPNVVKVNALGQESFQVSGTITEKALRLQISDDDVATVVEQTGVSRVAAEEAIRKHQGDLAAAIMELK